MIRDLRHRIGTVFVVAVSAALALSGCTSSSAGTPETDGLPELLASAVDAGKLIVGTSVNAPIAYVDTDSGDLLGVTPDVLREYLDRKGLADKVTLEVETMDFGSLIPALQSKRIDYMVDSMFVTEERKQVVDFTDTIFYNPEALVVPSGNPGGLAELADLCGKTAGSYEGTAYLKLLETASAECAGAPIDVKSYPKVDDVIADLGAGRLDAGLIDATVAAYGISVNPELGIELVEDYAAADRAASAASNALLPGNDDFLADFDAVLAEMREDGTLAEILDANGLSPAEYFINA